MATSNRILSLALTMFALIGCAPAADETVTDLATVDVASIRTNLSVSEVTALKAKIDVCRTGGMTAGRFVAPKAADMKTMSAYATAFVAGKASALVAGFAATKLGNGLTLVCEKSSSRRGGGAYLLRSGAAANVVVEVPHSFHDIGSLDVGLGLFMRTNARALLVNTSHRFKGARCVDSGSDDADVGCASDMAHTTVSHFHAVHEGLLAADAGLMVVAVHGFAPRAGDPDVILSQANTVACWNGVADQLNVELPSHVTMQYPEDIHELGGTTGAQAKQMQKMGGRMMHIELSKRLRTTLASDSKAADGFARAVASGLTNEAC
jgi:hypothetical protein